MPLAERRSEPEYHGNARSVKIALVHKRLDLKGGTERDLFQTAEGLRDLGHEVHLFCSEYGVEPPIGVPACRVPVIPLGRTFRLWSFAWFAPRILKRAKCDVVIGFGRLPGLDILRCGGGTHRGFLERLGRNGSILRRIWQNFSIYHQSLLAIEKRQFASGNFRKIIAVSEEVKRDIMINYHVPPEQITVLYNGVDTKRFHLEGRCAVRAAIRKRWNIPLDASLVLFVGSGFRRKGLDTLLSLWESPRLDAAYLLVVGADARLNHYRARADVIAPGRVVFTGRQNDIENYYAAADVLALLSLQEAFGNVILEALASGLPVLTSRDAGAAEIIRGPLAHGVVEDRNDRAALEDRLLALLAKSKNSETSRMAVTLAEQYSWENHFRKLDDLLSAVHRLPSA